MTGELKVGSAIPPFFLKDHEGYDVSDEDVLGTPLVLFFYPKDGTPGCTEEACGFQSNLSKFDKLQALVIGVSPDTVEAHKKFIKDNKLQYSLLSDPKKDMCLMYGVLDDKKEVVRTTIVVDSQGIVKWVEKPVNLKGHIDRVLAAIDEHCKEEAINFDDFEKDYADFLKGQMKPGTDEKKVHEEIMKEFKIKKEDLEDKKRK